jgi:hypothetical protein
MTFEPHFLTTHVGSVPYPSVEGISEKIASRVAAVLAAHLP